MADTIVEEALEAFKKAEEAESDNREDAKDDIEFARLGKQWPEEVERQRREERRPCLTNNVLQPTIRQVVNDARQNRPATAVHPIDGKADKETAEILTGLIRNIEASSDADVAYDTAVEHAVGGGFGYWRVNVDYALNALDEDGIKAAGESAFDKNIFIEAIPNQFSVYGDPSSQKADSSDWMQAHVIDVLTKDQFAEAYPDAEKTNFDADWSGVSSPWLDGDTVQIAEYWKRERVIKKAYAVQLENDIVVMFEDELAQMQQQIAEAGAQVIGQPRPVATYKVTQHIVSGVEELKKTEWAGAYIPIIPVYGDEVNLEGKRYWRSLIRDAKSSQQMLNYWDTTITEMVALAPRVPYIGEQGAFDVDTYKWATINTHSHSHVEFKKGSPQPQRNDISMIPAGMLQLAQSSADRIKAITGIYDASLGARSNETSGRAIMARQREGDVSTFHFIDNLSRAIRHQGRILVDLIPKVYSTPRMVRIMGEDGTSDEKPLNQEYEENGHIRIHDVRTGRYDVTVNAGPGFTSRREEAATQMMELLRAFPDAAPFIGDLLARNLDWPGADQIADRLEKMLPPQVKDEEQQIPPEVQQQLEQMQQVIQQGGQMMQQLQAELAQAKDEKGIKQQELMIKNYEAVTERLKEAAAVMPVEVWQQIVGGLMQDIAATEAAMPQSFPSEGANPFGQAA